MKQIDHLLSPIGCTHCGRCCGVTVCTGAEFDRVKSYAKANGIEPRRQGIDCPWLHDGRCLVYPVRPRVCAMFGHVPGMVCGEVPNRNIAPTLERRLMVEMRKESCHTGSRLVHEFVMPLEEIVGMVQEEVSSKSVPLTVDGVLGRRPPAKVYDAARTVSAMTGAFGRSAFIDTSGVDIGGGS